MLNPAILPVLNSLSALASSKTHPVSPRLGQELHYQLSKLLMYCSVRLHVCFCMHCIPCTHMLQLLRSCLTYAACTTLTVTTSVIGSGQSKETRADG